MPQPNTEQQEQEREANVEPRRRRRWPWILLGLLVLLYFLPAILVKTPLKKSLISYATADFKGSLDVEQISTGWFSPTTLSGISATDENGNTLLTANKITTSKTLYGLATAGNNYGAIHVQSPRVYLQLRPDGSNLEDAIANYMEPTDEPASDLPRLSLTLDDGEVQILAVNTAQSWLISDLNANAELGGETAAVLADLACKTSVTDESPGTLSLKLALDAGAKQVLADNGTCQLQSDAVPVSMFVPVMQRFVGSCNATGLLAGNADIQFTSGGSNVAANIERITLDNFALVAPDYLSGDQVSLQRVVTTGQLQLTPTSINAIEFEATCDVASATTNGQIDFSQLTATLPKGEVPGDFSAHGEVDLARLAQMLPNTLGLHRDLVVESGVVTFDASTRSGKDFRRLILDLGASNLTANRAGERLNWHKPLRVTARVAQTETDVVLEELRCQSDFVTITGDATSEFGNFVIENGDLSLLQENLSQFVDLEGMELAGKFAGNFGWSFKGEGQDSFGVKNRPVQIGGQFDINRPVIQMPGVPRWAPPKVTAICNAAGKSNTDGSIQINGGGARVVVDSEIFTARLKNPITDVVNAPKATFTCEVKGTIDGWLSHIRNFVWCGDFDASGRVVSEFDADVDYEKTVLSNLTYQLGNVAFDGYGARFVEPAINGDGRLSYNYQSGLLFMPVFNLASSGVSATGKSIRMTFDETMNVTGDVAFRADMNHVTNWYGLSPEPESVNWFGEANGTVQLSSNESLIMGLVDAKITGLVAAQRETVAQAGVRQAGQQVQWKELFREGEVAVQSQLGIAQDFDSFQFQNTNVNSSSIQMAADGSISDLAGSWVTNLTGEWNPDWEKIDGLLDAYTYETLKLAGSGRQSFEVSGPMFPAEVDPRLAQAWLPTELKVQTKLAWDSGAVMNMPLGASEIAFDVNQSVAFIETAEIPFVGGSLNLKPIVDLRTEEPRLIMEQGTIVNNIDLSSDVCREFLKYVTPLVADATQAQGKVTVSIESLQAPLYDPTKVQTNGVLRLQNGSIGAGPLAHQLHSTIQQVRQLIDKDASERELRDVWINLGNQDIPFAVQDGRVYHQDIRLNLDDIPVTTAGYVGLDQTMNMMATIPIQDEWLGDNRWLAGLRGQSIQIPIGGTVTKPQLDTRAVRQLSQQLVQQAASSAINTAVQEKTGEVQDRVRQEVQGVQEKINNKIQDKIGNELQKGLQGLFK